MNLPSGLPDHITEEEPLARFLTQSSHFKADRVLPSAFLPSPKSRETSVSRHGGDPLEQLRSLGRAAAGERNLYGAAIVRGADVRAASLEASSAEPPPYHAVIHGWPWLADAKEQKAAQLERALMLASAANAPILFEK